MTEADGKRERTGKDVLGRGMAEAPCSLGLSATSQQYFSLRTNQPAATSQRYFSLRTNQHQPSATSHPNRLEDGTAAQDTSRTSRARGEETSPYTGDVA
jgi:hypothetical protein